MLFGLTAAFCWGTADYLSKGQSERVGHYKTVVYSHLVTLTALLVLVPVLGASLAAPPFVVLALVAAGLLNFVAFNFLYDAFHRGAVSVVAPIAYTYPAVTTVLSIVVLKTFVSADEALAISGIILGVVLLSTRLTELRTMLRSGVASGLRVGVPSAVGSSVFFGTVYLAIGYAAPLAGYAVPAVILRAVGTVAGFALGPILHKDLRPSRLALSNSVLAMGTLEAVGFLAFTYGVYTAGGSLPIVAALSGLGGAVATACAMTFLRERLEPNQMVGVVLAIAGVFVLLYLGG